MEDDRVQTYKPLGWVVAGLADLAAQTRAAA